jgi:hypothetical protein
MVREGAPTMSLFAPAKNMEADRSLCPGLDPGIGMTGGAAGESVSTAVGIKFRLPQSIVAERRCPTAELS